MSILSWLLEPATVRQQREAAQAAGVLRRQAALKAQIEFNMLEGQYKRAKEFAPLLLAAEHESFATEFTLARLAAEELLSRGERASDAARKALAEKMAIIQSDRKSSQGWADLAKLELELKEMFETLAAQATEALRPLGTLTIRAVNLSRT
jgi:hypothetical protein